MGEGAQYLCLPRCEGPRPWQATHYRPGTVAWKRFAKDNHMTRIRRTIVGVSVAMAALLWVVTASADTQYMDLPGCAGSGHSEVQTGGNTYSWTWGCSGSSTLIASTTYFTGGGQEQCPYNWTWQATYLVPCYSQGGGAASVYSTHRMLYNGSYSVYVYTSDS
jgi:hypothetical protein